jgi:nucleoside-diphosphate-sugar epimerase
MRALVTGATGFVGYHLAKTLLAMGYEVHIVTRNHSNRWRIRHLDGLVTEHRVDLCCFSDVEQAVLRIKPNVVGHCATYGGFSFQNHADSIIHTNLLGTMNLLRACEITGFQTFIHTGSSSEYGIKQQPMMETDVLEPVSDYGVSKAATALYCRAQALRKNLPIVILRLFSPFGPWDDPARMMSYVITSLLRKERPIITSPTSVRDYIHIEDVMKAYKLVIQSSITPGEIYNIGMGKQTSVKEIVAYIREIIGTTVDPIWADAHTPLHESTTWTANINKAKHELLWLPTTSVYDGISDTVKWYEQQIRDDP